MSVFKKVMVGLFVLSAVVLTPVVSKGTNETQGKVILTSDNVVSLTGEINGESVSKTVMALRALDSKFALGATKPIYLFIYSPGGSIQDGLELIENVNGMNHRVDTITLFAASMAFQTVQNLGQRLILKNGVLMSHRTAGEFAGYFGGNRPSQIDSRYNFWLKRIEELDQKTVERTNGKQTMESYLKQYENESWMTGSQSVAQGYADSIVTVQCDKSLNGTDTHTVDFMGVMVQYETSKCPLITSPLNVKIVESNKGAVSDSLVNEIKNKFTESFDLSRMAK